MKAIGVYLGASPGNNPAFKGAVVKLASGIVNHGLTLVYGGSSLGMMGLLATTVKDMGGKAIGVMTTHLLDKEKPLDILDELHIVDSMQERKRKLQMLADAFIVMPGGLGTLEEAIETWNAIKIGELNKKIGFLNIDDYFSKLFSFVEHCRANGFIHSNQSLNPIVHTDPCQLLFDLIQPNTLEKTSKLSEKTELV